MFVFVYVGNALVVCVLDCVMFLGFCWPADCVLSSCLVQFKSTCFDSLAGRFLDDFMIGFLSKMWNRVWRIA